MINEYKYIIFFINYIEKVIKNIKLCYNNYVKQGGF